MVEREGSAPSHEILPKEEVESTERDLINSLTLDFFDTLMRFPEAKTSFMSNFSNFLISGTRAVHHQFEFELEDRYIIEYATKGHDQRTIKILKNLTEVGINKIAEESLVLSTFDMPETKQASYIVQYQCIAQDNESIIVHENSVEAFRTARSILERFDHYANEYNSTPIS